MRYSTTLILSAFLSLTLAACQREDAVRAYQVPKEPVPDQTPLLMADAPGQQPAAENNIQWTIPKGWKPMPAGQMRFAVFAVSDQKNAPVLTVIPLSGESGGLAANINRWEGQLGLQPTPAENLPKLIKKAKAGDLELDTIDLATPETAKDKLRMLGAVLKRPERTWYFKLVGPADIVAAQKENFDAFIASIKFGPGPTPGVGDLPAADQLPPGHPQLPGQGPGGNVPPGHPQIPGQADPNVPPGHPQIPGQVNPNIPPGHPQVPAQGTGPASAQPPADAPKFEAPKDWELDPTPRPMRLLTLTTPGDDKAATAIVSRFPKGAFGDLGANINRWRQQAGLEPAADPSTVKPQQTDTALGKADVYDFAGQGPDARRLIVVMIPDGEDVLFVRIAGPAATVEKQKAGFDAFVKSLKK